MSKQRIPHKQILQSLQGPPDGPANIVAIYRDKVLSGKTRTIQLLGRKGPARVTNTLLGYEVQGGYKRVHCPDMVTARYLRLFMELGCRSIQLPYDPTVTAAIVPRLERAFDNIALSIREMFPQARQTQVYVMKKLSVYLRRQLRTIHPPAGNTAISDSDRE
jgi:hypothetical protein